MVLVRSAVEEVALSLRLTAKCILKWNHCCTVLCKTVPDVTCTDYWFRSVEFPIKLPTRYPTIAPNFVNIRLLYYQLNPH